MFRVSRDRCGIVIVTLLAPLTVEDRPVLCRAVQEELRHPARHLALDLGADPPGPVAVSAALRIHTFCAARGVSCAVVTRDPDMVRRAITDNAPTGAAAGMIVTGRLTTALTPPG